VNICLRALNDRFTYGFEFDQEKGAFEKKHGHHDLTKDNMTDDKKYVINIFQVCALCI